MRTLWLSNVLKMRSIGSGTNEGHTFQFDSWDSRALFMGVFKPLKEKFNSFTKKTIHRSCLLGGGGPYHRKHSISLKANIIYFNAFVGNPLCSIVKGSMTPYNVKKLPVLTIPLRINRTLRFSTAFNLLFCHTKNITMPVYFKLRTAGPSSQAQTSPPCTTCPALSGSEPKWTSGWWWESDILPAEETQILFLRSWQPDLCRDEHK